MARPLPLMSLLFALAGLPATAGDGEHIDCDQLGAALRPLTVPSASGLLTGLATCRTSLQTGGLRAVNCNFAHAYRAETARRNYNALVRLLGRCYAAPEIPSGGVSHPDSFDQAEFTTPNGMVSVSLKDKAALNATYVFLNIAEAPE